VRPGPRACPLVPLLAGFFPRQCHLERASAPELSCGSVRPPSSGFLGLHGRMTMPLPPLSSVSEEHSKRMRRPGRVWAPGVCHDCSQMRWGIVDSRSLRRPASAQSPTRSRLGCAPGPIGTTFPGSSFQKGKRKDGVDAVSGPIREARGRARCGRHPGEGDGVKRHHGSPAPPVHLAYCWKTVCRNHYYLSSFDWEWASGLAWLATAERTRKGGTDSRQVDVRLGRYRRGSRAPAARQSAGCGTLRPSPQK
jgi:hypothetical protein